MAVVLLLTLLAGNEQSLAAIGKIGIGKCLLYKGGLAAFQKSVYYINRYFISKTHGCSYSGAAGLMSADY